MPVILPAFPSEPRHTFTTTIRGVEVFIEARWNARDKVVVDGVEKVRGAWYLDWYDADGKAIVLGMKVVLGVNLGRHVTHELFKRIIVRAVDQSMEGRDADLDDYGSRVIVKVYTITDEGLIE